MHDEVAFRGLPDLRARVAALDPSAPADRDQLLALLEELLQQNIRAASDLLVEAGDGVLVLDEEAMAGERITGLLLSLLAEDTPTLDVGSDPEQSRAALAQVDIDIDDADRAHAVYRSWQARRALCIVEHLLDISTRASDLEALPGAAEEARRVAGQMTPDLPDQALRSLARFVVRRSRDTAAALCAQQSEARIQQAFQLWL